LIAYSQPSEPKTLRTQTTLAASIWSSYDRLSADGTISKALPNYDRNTGQPSSESSAAIAISEDKRPQESSAIKNMTLEMRDANIHIQEIRPQLLLALISIKSSSYPSPTATSPASKAPSNAHLSRDASKLNSRNSSAHSSSKQFAAVSTGGSHSPATSPTSNAVLGSRAGDVGGLQLLKRRAEKLAEEISEDLGDFEMPDTM
jgi:hypothetical protein